MVEPDELNDSSGGEEGSVRAGTSEVAEMYTYEQIRAENEAFAGTAGISQNNYHERFVPAFRDSETGQVEIARQESGEPAAMHLLCCLPDEWVTERDQRGQILALRASVVAGFVKDGRFYTREEAAGSCR